MTMDIVRNEDGSLTVPVVPGRHSGDDESTAPDAAAPVAAAATMVLRPGEGGYVEALAEWDLQQHPDHADAVSTVHGREEAMAVVHAVVENRDQVAEAVDAAR